MKKFLFDLFLLLAVVLTGYLVIAFIVNKTPRTSNDYMSAMIDKHQRVQKIKKPKIIFAGGSNLAFGINSEEIQDKFKVPVVNLGLHAGLGLEFIINELKESIHDNDVVILSIEYFLGDGVYDLKNHTRDLYPEASGFYNKNIIKDIQTHIDKTRKNLKTLNQEKTIDTTFSVYSRKGFNKYGDVIAHLEQLPPIELKDKGVMTYHYWEGIKVLNEFYNYAKSKNVAVFFIFPNYPKSEYEKNQTAITKLQNDIIKNLSIEVINTPQDFVFDDSLFFDTVYHLNKKGRELRTEKLIEIILRSTNAQQCIYKIGGTVINSAL